MKWGPRIELEHDDHWRLLRCFLFTPFNEDFFTVTCAVTVSLGKKRVAGFHRFMSLN